MDEARISEIFISYQGEGPYLGEKQLFIRFHGCSLNCDYCDTRPASYQTFTREGLLEKIREFGNSYNSVSITGGEPLEQAEFLKGFLPLLKKTLKKPVYLETNGVMFRELESVLDYVDIVAMDIKLPSSTGKKISFWEEHKKFLNLAKTKKTFVKVIATDRFGMDELMKAKEIVQSADPAIPFILQPVDPIRRVRAPEGKVLSKFRRELARDLKDVRIIPQWHKAANIK